LYEEIENNGVRILVFSGDADGSVPTVDTLTWVSVNYIRKGNWVTWNITDNEIAGFT